MINKNNLLAKQTLCLKITKKNTHLKIEAKKAHF